MSKRRANMPQKERDSVKNKIKKAAIPFAVMTAMALSQALPDINAYAATAIPKVRITFSEAMRSGNVLDIGDVTNPVHYTLYANLNPADSDQSYTLVTSGTPGYEGVVDGDGHPRGAITCNPDNTVTIGFGATLPYGYYKMKVEGLQDKAGNVITTDIIEREFSALPASSGQYTVQTQNGGGELEGAVNAVTVFWSQEVFQASSITKESFLINGKPVQSVSYGASNNTHVYLKPEDYISDTSATPLVQLIKPVKLRSGGAILPERAGTVAADYARPVIKNPWEIDLNSGTIRISLSERVNASIGDEKSITLRATAEKGSKSGDEPIFYTIGKATVTDIQNDREYTLTISEGDLNQMKIKKVNTNVSLRPNADTFAFKDYSNNGCIPEGYDIEQTQVTWVPDTTPVALTDEGAVSFIGDGDGKMEQGETIRIKFTEPVDKDIIGAIPGFGDVSITKGDNYGISINGVCNITETSGKAGSSPPTVTSTDNAVSYNADQTEITITIGSNINDVDNSIPTGQDYTFTIDGNSGYGLIRDIAGNAISVPGEQQVNIGW